MKEAYKVGITIALTNQISRGLMLIGRDLAKTDAQARKLHGTLKDIQKLGVAGAIVGGAGYAGLRTLDKAYDVAKEYQQALAQFKSLNLGDAINTQADKFARGANIIGASATDLMKTTRDLTTVLGDFGLARQLAPGFAQLKYANQAVYGGHGLDFNEGQLRDLERIIEMKGGFKTPQDFLAQASMMQQVIAGTGGMVKPSDYLNFIKTAGVSGRLLSDKSFYYGMEPLIQELGGNRVGTALMSAYNNLAQGKSTVRSARELMRLGLVDPSMVEYTKIGTIKAIRPGALKGMEQFASDPFGWMNQVLIPAMQAKGISGEAGTLNEMGAVFGNRTASSLFSLMYLQREKIEKNMKLSQGAMGTDDLVKLARSSPQGAEMALGKAWENLKIAAGESLIPIIIPALNKFADLLRDLGGWINRHPVKFDYLVKGFAALSAILLAGGFVIGLAALVKSFTILGGLVPTFQTMAAIPFAGMATGLGLLTAALAALAPVVFHKQIADAIDARAPGVGDALLRAKEWLDRGDDTNGWRRGVVPKARSNSSGQNAAVYLDGRVVGQVVSGHQYKDMNTVYRDAAGFDTRLSFVAP